MCVMNRERGGAVPVILPRLEEHAVAGPDDLDRPAAPLCEPHAFDDVDRLAVRMGMPRRPAPGVKLTLVALSREEPVGAATGVEVDGAREQSLGPVLVSIPLLVICIAPPRSACTPSAAAMMVAHPTNSTNG